MADKESNYNISIPDYVCEAKNLTPFEKLVFGYIYSLAYQNGKCWATDKYISNLLDYSDRQVRGAINKLKNNGYISVTYEYYPDTKNIKHRYIEIDDTAKNRLLQVRNSTSTGCGNTLPQGMEVHFQEVRKPASTNNIIDNINNNVEETSTTQKYKKEVAEIIDYLNLKTGKKFRTKSKATIKIITARLNEEYTVDDFKRIIDNQVAQWSNAEKMQQYLRPETLFCASHFESYLNSNVTSTSNQNWRNNLLLD